MDDCTKIVSFSGLRAAKSGRLRVQAGNRGCLVISLDVRLPSCQLLYPSSCYFEINGQDEPIFNVSASDRSTVHRAPWDSAPCEGLVILWTVLRMENTVMIHRVNGFSVKT